ncbi:MAG TPA: aminotransferase class IV, partial [Flavisolibacter sp.]
MAIHPSPLVLLNNEFLPYGPLLEPGNRGFRYGDGLFETIKVSSGKILLEEFHFDRLFLGLGLMRMNGPSTLPRDRPALASALLDLCSRNNCSDLARVRLAVFRNSRGGADYLAEASPLSEEADQWNEEGWAIDIYPYARKSADAFANLKTANHLPYVMAELFAREKGLDDALVLNGDNHICDSSKANIFLIKGNDILTPALHQGCVSGVMRRFLINELKDMGYRVEQQEVSEEDLRHAEEVFLTNAIRGIRWVRSFRDVSYAASKALGIWRRVQSLIVNRE